MITDYLSLKKLYNLEGGDFVCHMVLDVIDYKSCQSIYSNDYKNKKVLDKVPSLPEEIEIHGYTEDLKNMSKDRYENKIHSYIEDHLESIFGYKPSVKIRKVRNSVYKVILFMLETPDYLEIMSSDMCDYIYEIEYTFLEVVNRETIRKYNH